MIKEQRFYNKLITQGMKTIFPLKKASIVREFSRFFSEGRQTFLGHGFFATIQSKETLFVQSLINSTIQCLAPARVPSILTRASLGISELLRYVIDIAEIQ